MSAWRRIRSRRGYSLPELMTVLGVIGAVAGMATVGILRHRQDAEDVRMQGELASIYKAMEAYRNVYGRYPRSYAELSEFISVPNFNAKYDINPNP